MCLETILSASSFSLRSTSFRRALRHMHTTRPTQVLFVEHLLQLLEPRCVLPVSLMVLAVNQDVLRLLRLLTSADVDACMMVSLETRRFCLRAVCLSPAGLPNRPEMIITMQLRSESIWPSSVIVCMQWPQSLLIPTFPLAAMFSI